jgi:hypothetical protein
LLLRQKFVEQVCFWYCLSFILFLLSCTNPKQAEAEKQLTSWTNKTVNFPAGIPCSYLGRDTEKTKAMAQILQTKEPEIGLITMNKMRKNDKLTL